MTHTCEVNTAQLKCTLAHFPASPPTPLAAKLGKSPTTSSSKAGNDESIQCLEDGTLTMGRKKHSCLRDSLTEVKLGTNPDHLTWASFALNVYTSYKGMTTTGNVYLPFSDSLTQGVICYLYTKAWIKKWNKFYSGMQLHIPTLNGYAESFLWPWLWPNSAWYLSPLPPEKESVTPFPNDCSNSIFFPHPSETTDTSVIQVLLCSSLKSKVNPIRATQV